MKQILKIASLALVLALGFGVSGSFAATCGDCGSTNIVEEVAAEEESSEGSGCDNCLSDPCTCLLCTTCNGTFVDQFDYEGHLNANDQCGEVCEACGEVTCVCPDYCPDCGWYPCRCDYVDTDLDGSCDECGLPVGPDDTECGECESANDFFDSSDI